MEIRETIWEIEELRDKMEVVKARIIKEIWSDPSITKEQLRRAELTLRLADHEEYQTLKRKERELLSERETLLKILARRVEELERELAEAMEAKEEGGVKKWS